MKFCTLGIILRSFYFRPSLNLFYNLEHLLFVSPLIAYINAKRGLTRALEDWIYSVSSEWMEGDLDPSWTMKSS